MLLRTTAAALALALAGACSPVADTAPERVAEGPDEEEGGPESCELSPLAASIHQAARTSNPDMSLVPLDGLLTTANLAGPALVEGPEIFPTLADMIADASVDVNIAFFEWEVGSDASDALLRGLVDLDIRLNDLRAGNQGVWERDPVQVRIVLNAPRYAEQLTVEPLRRAIDALDLDPALVAVQVASRPVLAFGVMHEKLAIIDGLHVHLGGANIQAYNDWTGDNPPWWDSAYVVSGQVAQSALYAFETLWSEGSVWECDDPNVCTESQAPAFTRVQPEALIDGCTPMILLNRRAIGEPNNDVDSAMSAGYLAAVDNARRHIHIQTPNLNDDAVKDALLRALVRGVEVRVVLPLGFNDNFTDPLIFGQGGTNAENADELYLRAAEALDEAGLDPAAACELLDIRWFSRELDDGSVVVIDDTECETLPEDACAGGHVHGAAHAKYMSVDDQVVLVGSMNQDTQSYNNSGETNVAIDSPETTARYDSRLFDPAFEIATPTGHCADR